MANVYTQKGVSLAINGEERLPYQVGDRVQVRYTRRVDRKDPGFFYAVAPTDGHVNWWPIYGDRARETIGTGTITRVSGATCWVRIGA